ncbi:MAG: DUF1573 domain-containing protein, partial [Thermoanaerobaculia bacterium]
MTKRMFAMTLVALLVASFAAAQTAGAPKVSVVDPIKDFGTVSKGQKLDWAFTVKNEGNKDLEILAVRPACGCTVAEFDKIIKPGQTGKIAAHVDTTAFSGPIAKGITVETSDPLAPTVQLTMSAIVKPYVEAFPAGFVRFNLLQGDVETQMITLYSEEEQPFEIVRIESPQPWIKTSFTKATGDAIVQAGRAGQNQYRVAFMVGANDAKEGPIAEKVRIVTNSPHQPEYWISVAGLVRPTVFVAPTGINFGEVAPTDAAATRIVSLRSLTKTPETFLVQKAETNVKGVTASIAPTGIAGEYHVTLKVD